MATVTKKVGFTIEIDEDTIAPATVNVFIYQLVNRLNYEHKITSITIDEVTKEITDASQIKNMPLKKDEDLKDDEDLEIDEKVEELEESNNKK